MRNFDKGVIGGVAGIGAIALTALIHGLVKGGKIDKVCSKLNTTMDGLADGVKPEIEESIVAQAIERAAEREAKKQVTYFGKAAISKVEADMNEQIRKTVDSCYQDTEKAVQDKLNAEVDRVGNAGIRELKRQAIDDAKDKISDMIEDAMEDILEAGKERFNDELDDILRSYKDKLDDTGKIYEAFANAFGKKA